MVCTGRRGEGSGDERTMLLLVSWRRESRYEQDQREREKKTGRRSSERGGTVTGVGDGVERRWSPARPVRRGTTGEGGVHSRSKTRGWELMDLNIMVVAEW